MTDWEKGMEIIKIQEESSTQRALTSYPLWRNWNWKTDDFLWAWSLKERWIGITNGYLYSKRKWTLIKRLIQECTCIYSQWNKMYSCIIFMIPCFNQLFINQLWDRSTMVSLRWPVSDSHGLSSPDRLAQASFYRYLRGA